jgi:flagellar motor switch protein FliM
MTNASSSMSQASMGHFNPASLLSNTSQTNEANPFAKETIERIAEACIPQFNKTFGEGVSISFSLVSLTNEIASEFLASLEKTAVTGLFEVPGANSRMVVSLEYDFVQLYMELMCGGTCGEALPDEPRLGTAIDRQFARSAFNLIAPVFEKECAIFHLGAISFGQIETKLDPLVLGSRLSKVTVATLALECRGVSATLRAAIPSAITERLKLDALPASSAAAALDPHWTEHFQSEVGRAMVKLDAYLDANSLRLGDIASLKVGQTLLLPRMVSSRCELRSEKKLLFRCELGQTDGRYSVRISEASPEPESAGPEALNVLNPFE